MDLDPWQAHVLSNSLLQRNGKWAAFEVALICPRQNGKNEVIAARELAGLFVLGEKLIVHSAHLADTAKEAFRRFDQLLEANEWLSREVEHVWRANGSEAVELRNGARIKFKTRTLGGGRGLSGDLAIFDEAMIFPEASQAAVLPILSTRPNPQAWYTGSAVDKSVHDNGRVFSRLRHRGVGGNDDSLAFFEWSLDYPNPDDVPYEVLADLEQVARANPAMGIRISPEYVLQELAALGPRAFAIERGDVGDWDEDDGTGVISLETWNALLDPGSRALDPVAFGFDVSPNRSTAAISVAGKRSDGLMHIGVVEHDRGTGWVVPHLIELAKENPAGFVCDKASPANSLLPELEDAGIEVTAVSALEHGQAYGMFLDACFQRKLRHRGTPELSLAVRGAAERSMGESSAWARRSSLADITPLVACTLALWQSATADTYKEPWIAWR